MKVKFFINKEKKIVVCLIKRYDIFCNQDSLIKGIRGKAVCSDEDVFNVEIGKKIAFKKALIKYYIALLKELKKSYNEQVKDIVHDFNVEKIINFSNKMGLNLADKEMGYFGVSKAIYENKILIDKKIKELKNTRFY